MVNMTNSSENREYLLVAEAAQILRVTPKHIYDLIERKEFPGIRVGQSIRIPADEFEAWRKKPRDLSA